MFEDQKVELLPERTTMQTAAWSFNTATAAALNAGNINAGKMQANLAAALSLAGSSVKLGH